MEAMRRLPTRVRAALGPEHAVLLAIIVVAWISRWSTLHQNLYEAFGFRQTQTAFTARIMHEQGISLLHAKMPVLGSPWEVPFELPLFQASAAILMNLGVGVIAAVRVAALAWFSLTAVMVFVIVRRWHSRTAACIATLIFCFTPHAFVYSRASLIEYCATAFVLLWLYAALRAVEEKSYRWAAAAAIMGGLAAMVKATTFVPWMIPLVFFILATRQLRVHLARAAILIGFPLLMAIIWTSHADDIKAANPSTTWLTSSALQEWNFGTLHQRLSPDRVGHIINYVETLLTGPGIWIGVAAACVFAVRSRALWAGIALVPVAAVSIFFNLYYVHDYYLAAVAPAIAIALGVGLTTLSERIHSGIHLRQAALIGITAVWLVTTLWYSGHFWRKGTDAVGPPVGADQIAPLTEVDDRVLVSGYDWSPEVLFWASRWGLMYRPSETVTYETLQNLPEHDQYRLLFVSFPDSHLVDVASFWPWYGAAASQSIELATELEDIRHSYAVVGTDGTVFDAHVANAEQVVAQSTLVCDSTTSVVLHGGTGELWIRTNWVDTVRFMQPGLPVLLAAAGLVILPNADNVRGDFTLMCAGGGQVQFTAVVDASGS